jgi:beta propeller repeat protein
MNGKKKVLILVVLLLFTAPFIFPVRGQGTETLISTDTFSFNQIVPKVSGNNIVWEDRTNSTADIILYNIANGAETLLTPDVYVPSNPAISGNWVVWQDTQTGFYDIYRYDIFNGTAICLTPGTPGTNQVAPSIDGTRIVWIDTNLTGPDDVILYDFSNGINTPTTLVVTADERDPAADPTSPAIDGDYIVWQDSRNTPDDEIYRYTISQGSIDQLTPTTAGLTRETPAISGNWITWQEMDDVLFTYDIYIYDVTNSTITLLTPPAMDVNQQSSAISGNRIAFIDYTNATPPGTPDIIVNDTTSINNPVVTLITPDSSSLASPISLAIDGDRIVWQDTRVANADIYMYTLGTSVTCPVASFTRDIYAGPAPQTVRFTDTTTGSVSTWYWNFGDGATSLLQTRPASYPHTYTQNIPYDVTLTVSNPYCRNATRWANSITLGRPVASFTANSTEGFVPLPVQFTDTSSGTVTSRQWDFNDGSPPSADINPVHVFDHRGTFTVTLTATNGFGSTTAQQTIMVVKGTTQTVDTSLVGILVQNVNGAQYAALDTTAFPDYTFNPSDNPTLVFTPPSASNIKNVTLFSNDGIGFSKMDNWINGTITSASIESLRLVPTDFTDTGSQSSINYALNLSSFPTSAKLNTTVWEGYLPLDRSNYLTTVHGAGFTSMEIAYSADFTPSGIQTHNPAILNMSLSSTWVTIHGGSAHIYIIRYGSDGQGNIVGEVLRTTFAGSNAGLDYFEAESPRGFSKVAIAALSGSGNVFQIVVLEAAQHLESPPPNDSSGGPKSITTTGQGLMSQQNQPLAPAPASPAAPVAKTAELYINDQAVITQTTVLQSADQLATVSIGQGVTALDASGHPLSSVSIGPPSTEIPEVPQGGTLSFAGIACELLPDGATFSPAVTITFTVPQAQWSQHYMVKEYDPLAQVWVDLPTTYHPESGTISASVSHFCIIALFSDTIKPSQTPLPTAVHTPLPTIAPPQPTSAFGIFYGMVVWLADLCMKNGYLILIVAAIVVAFYINRRRKGRDSLRYK